MRFDSGSLMPQTAVLDARTARVLPWLVAIAFFMQTLDGTILNTALPAMARDLAEDPLRMQGVIIAYMLTVALLIPASGWIADRFGTRKIFFSAILLFSLGSVFAMYEGIHKLEHPEPLDNPLVAYIILGVAAVLEGLSLRTAIKESREAKDDLTWFEFLRKAKIPELPVGELHEEGREQRASGLADARIVECAGG